MALKNKIGLTICGLALMSLGVACNASAIEFTGDGLSEDGKFHVRMVPPSNEPEQYTLSEKISEMVGGGWSLSLTNCKDNFSSCKLMHYGELTDDYYNIVYEYDEVVKEKVDAILEDFEVPEEGFFVTDAELVKYWVFGGENLAAVSSEVKTALDYVNLTVNVRGGGDDPLLTHNIGDVEASYGDTLYAVVDNGPEKPTKVVAPHILYVPTGSSDLARALIDRFVEIYGEEAREAVGVVATNQKVSDLVDPDDELSYGYFENYLDAKVFEMKIDFGEMQSTYKIIIVADSSKLENGDGVNSTDLLTDINIKTEAENLPGDTATWAENLGSDVEDFDEDFDGEYHVYEIGLYSASVDSNISDSDDGFEVSIPVPENLKGIENLSAYWKNFETGELEEHRAEIVNGNAVFETTHFSTYALAESTEKPEEPPVEPEKPAEPETDDSDVAVPGAPDTGAGVGGLSSVVASLPIFGVVFVAVSAVAFVLARKNR